MTLFKDQVHTISFSTPPIAVTLSDNIIDVWLCQLTDIENRNPLFLPQLSKEEKNRAERFKFDIHRNRFIASHGFVRTVLAKYLNCETSDIDFLKGEQGKPYLSISNSGNLQFNLSHTQDVAILAVTKDVAVGVDIEHNDRKTDWKGICKRFFTEPEQEALFSLNTEQQANAFFDLWTRKEAYMKVLGTGLSLSPTEFTLSVFPEKPTLIKHHSKKFKPLKQVNFTSLHLPEQLDSYNATLAAASEEYTCCYYQFT
ncbi:MAG: 4'-phosphopantetheinyl transferase superfamily protein [Gammaproteobacteria bacterium]|nr:4'-phosphopantetheinyl transferase superfamily protein [Gammaproteobacteria bacterium]